MREMKENGRLSMVGFFIGFDERDGGSLSCLSDGATRIPTLSSPPLFPLIGCLVPIVSGLFRPVGPGLFVGDFGL